MLVSTNNVQIESDACLAPSTPPSDLLLSLDQEIAERERESRINIDFYIDPQVDE